jgi:hypothetical protein
LVVEIVPLVDPACVTSSAEVGVEVPGSGSRNSPVGTTQLGTGRDAGELVRTVAGVESSDGAAAETLEDVVDLVVETPCEEVKEVVPLGARRAAVERVVAG